MTAFRAAFADMKLVKTRGVTQLIFEIPTEEFDTAYEILGGVPLAGKERWFGIAAIQVPQAEKENSKLPAPAPAPATARQDPKSAGPKRDWRDVPPSQQAGIRINEPTFAAYLREEHSDEWHETGDADACLKMILRIESKTELKTDPRRMTLWHQLDTAYSAWLAKERIGA